MALVRFRTTTRHFHERIKEARHTKALSAVSLFSHKEKQSSTYPVRHLGRADVQTVFWLAVECM